MFNVKKMSRYIAPSFSCQHANLKRFPPHNRQKTTLTKNKNNIAKISSLVFPQLTLHEVTYYCFSFSKSE
jgi:hypothetical protein